jgi:hypothetical protein
VRRQTWIDKDQYEALRADALVRNEACAEDALERVLAAYLTANPKLAEYVKARARLREQADTEAKRLAGL